MNSFGTKNEFIILWWKRVSNFNAFRCHTVSNFLLPFILLTCTVPKLQGITYDLDMITEEETGKGPAWVCIFRHHSGTHLTGVGKISAMMASVTWVRTYPVCPVFIRNQWTKTVDITRFKLTKMRSNEFCLVYFRPNWAEYKSRITLDWIRSRVPVHVPRSI